MPDREHQKVIDDPELRSADAGAEIDDELQPLLRLGIPMLAVVFGTAVLYFARDILLPLAMATMLSVIFSPLARRIEAFIGRLAASALVVLGAVALVGAIAYFLTTELSMVADQVADYTPNIAAKLTAMQKNTPASLQRFERAIESVEKEVEHAMPKRTAMPRTVQAIPQSSLGDNLKPLVPVLSGLVDFLLVVVLLFFLLYSRNDLRDRMVRLAARAHISVASQAIETAGHTVSRYLILFSLVNLGFGIAGGLVCLAVGLPNPELWGLLAFLLRYIPYVGTLMSSVMPTLVAFAVFPGWDKSIEIAVAFIALDQFAAQLVEPFLIGGGIGISPTALLISAMYWSWIWGPLGLLLATPLTACIKVLGDYVPAFSLFSILLGSERPLEDYHDFYRKMLELDPEGARALIFQYYDEHGFEAAVNDVIVPTVIVGAEEYDRENIGAENLQSIMTMAREMIVQIGNRLNKIQRTPRLRMVALCVPGEVHNLALLILVQLMRRDEVAATLISEHKTVVELREFVRGFAPDLVCLSITRTETLAPAMELIGLLRADSEQLMIVAGGLTAIQNAEQLRQAGCNQVCMSVGEARRAIRARIAERARVRRSGWNPVRRAAASSAQSGRI
ncbi:MAG TPA: AI-2E family transporter [Candidatus Binataceae bacterium]|nr:AI-2E family transporter [Candidatus Binataceae bacterium]